MIERASIVERNIREVFVADEQVSLHVAALPICYLWRITFGGPWSFRIRGVLSPLAKWHSQKSLYDSRWTDDMISDG